MAGGFVVGKNPKFRDGGDEMAYLAESMSSIRALCFGDTIIAVFENQFPEIIPAITFIYDHGLDTLDFSSLDKTAFNKAIRILEAYFNSYHYTASDNTAEDVAKHVWVGSFYPYVQQDERYDPDYKIESV